MGDFYSIMLILTEDTEVLKLAQIMDAKIQRLQVDIDELSLKVGST